MKHHETLGSESDAEQVLAAFYKDIQDWLNEGCPDHTIFNTAQALCSTLLRYMRGTEILLRVRDIASTLMKKGFADAGLCPIYPFNPVRKKENDKGLTFDEEFARETFYFNKARLKWIWEHSK